MFQDISEEVGDMFYCDNSLAYKRWKYIVHSFYTDKQFFNNRDEIKLSVREGISQDNVSAVKTFR